MIDLHTHSIYSDGTCTPEELLSAAENAGLSAIALCDHNTVSGLPDFLAAAARHPSVEAVPGAEFSTDYEGTELHILALYLSPSVFPDVTRMMEEAQQRKEKSNRLLVSRLCEHGYDLVYEEITGKTPNGQINRAHIAAALTEKGYTSSIKEAFRTLLSPEAGFYEAPGRINAFSMIKNIKSWGAAAVLAHPLVSMDRDSLLSFLPEAVNCGLDGLEAYYSEYGKEETAFCEASAKQFGLLKSGGSDFHGKNKPDIALGTGKGSLCIEDGLLAGIRERSSGKEN